MSCALTRQSSDSQHHRSKLSSCVLSHSFGHSLLIVCITEANFGYACCQYSTLLATNYYITEANVCRTWWSTLLVIHHGGLSPKLLTSSVGTPTVWLIQPQLVNELELKKMMERWNYLLKRMEITFCQWKKCLTAIMDTFHILHIFQPLLLFLDVFFPLTLLCFTFAPLVGWPLCRSDSNFWSLDCPLFGTGHPYYALFP